MTVKMSGPSSIKRTPGEGNARSYENSVEGMDKAWEKFIRNYMLIDPGIVYEPVNAKRIRHSFECGFIAARQAEKRLRERLQEKNELLMAYAEHGTPDEGGYVFEWRARLSRLALSLPHAYVYADDPDGETGRCQLCDVARSAHQTPESSKRTPE